MKQPYEIHSDFFKKMIASGWYENREIILYFQTASISLLRTPERHCSRRTILWKLKIEMTF